MTSAVALHPPALATAPRPGSVAAAGHESAVTLSVIVVSYNSQHHLGPCLQSVLATAGPQVEVILVDNASTDGSAQYVERCFPEVRVVRNRDNHGFGHANNVGARCARGQYLAFLNPDTIVEPDWLSALIEALENDSIAILATSMVLDMKDPQRVSACGNEMHYTGIALGRAMGMSRQTFTEVEEVSAISGAAFAARRDAFFELGGFDPDFFLYMEDVDLSLRAWLVGGKVLHVPQSAVYHDYALCFGPRKTFYQERNRYLMLLKSFHWKTLLILAPALFLTELVTWGFVVLRERKDFRNKLRAYRWIIAHWGAIMQKRKQTQATRQAQDRELVRRCNCRLAYEQTGTGVLTSLAHFVLDPLFCLYQRLMLLLIRW